MMRTKFAAVVALPLLILCAAIAIHLSDPPVEATDAVDILIIAPDESIVWTGPVVLNPGNTALDVLLRASMDGGFTVDIEEYPFGKFVSSINGVASDDTGGWTYWVLREGERIDPEVGSDAFEVEASDVIRWHWSPWSGVE